MVLIFSRSVQSDGADFGAQSDGADFPLTLMVLMLVVSVACLLSRGDAFGCSCNGDSGPCARALGTFRRFVDTAAPTRRSDRYILSIPSEPVIEGFRDNRVVQMRK